MTSGTNPVHCPCFNTIGYLRDSSQPLLENIQGYQYYWVGYDLMPSQRIDDAFGDEWSNVRGIRGEDWSYSRKDRGGRPVVPCWSPVGKYLEFGKGYIVSFWDDMPSFRWHNRHFLFSDIPHSKRAETFTFEEKYRLSDQMIRASRSSTANIAEGYGRFHFQENIQFCRQARGSLYELIDHTLVAEECEYIDHEVSKAIIDE